jgi:hypothetical protein
MPRHLPNAGHIFVMLNIVAGRQLNKPRLMEHRESAGGARLAGVWHHSVDYREDGTPGTGAAPRMLEPTGSRGHIGHIDFKEQFPYDSKLVTPHPKEAGFEQSLEPSMLERGTIQSSMTMRRWKCESIHERCGERGGCLCRPGVNQGVYH